MKRILIPVLAAFLVGCSPSLPSVEDARKAVEQEIAKESQGRIKLVSFKKMDGQQMEAFGVKGYSMKYEAEIEFTKDANWHGGFSASEYASKGKDFDALMGVHPVKAGERKNIKDTVEFEKTEKGWQTHQL